MIDQSINSLNELLDILTSNSKSYYIEQKGISTIIEFNGHTTYSRYKKFDGKITPILIEQHLKKEINLAIAINNTNNIVYEYRGKHQEAFVSLISYFYKKEGIDSIYITAYDTSKIVVLLTLNKNSNLKSKEIQKKIEKKLENKLIKEWRVLPNNLRPEIGNLFILPREFIKKS